MCSLLVNAIFSVVVVIVVVHVIVILNVDVIIGVNWCQFQSPCGVGVDGDVMWSCHHSERMFQRSKVSWMALV